MRDLAHGWVPIWQVRDDQEHETVKAQPRYRGCDDVGEQEDEEGAEEFAEVGAADHNMRPGAVAEVAAGDGGRDAVFKVSVSVQTDAITGEEPNEFAGGEDNLATGSGGFDKEVEAHERGSDIRRLPF